MSIRPASLAAVLILWAAPAAAQTRTVVTGTVADTTGASLPGATVVLLERRDSTLVAFAAAGPEGAFRIRAVPPGAYLLRATFVGFLPADRPVEVGSEALDVGRIVLVPDDGTLGELVVRAQQPPVVVRGDTLDFDAAAFGTAPGATVEDLLRRLPGVEVSRDGTVRAQGEEVQRVLVDGKEFFGTDPTVATRNLPADAVDRVQVYDRKSDTADFTGVDDGQRERTINLALRPERRVGYFGNATGSMGGDPGDGSGDGSGRGPATGRAAGLGGTGLRYDTGLSLNRFAPETQLSVLGNANNVNRQGFSVGEAVSFAGGMSAMGGGGGVIRIEGGSGGSFGPGGVPISDGAGDGFSQTASGGVNAGHDFSATSSLRGSYFGNRVETDRDRTLVQRRALGDGLASRLDETGTQNDRRDAHRLSLDAKHEFADGHDLRLRSGLRTSDTATRALTDRTALGADGQPENAATTATDQDSRDTAGDARITYRRRLPAGRSVVAEATATLSGSRSDGTLDSDARFFADDGTVTQQTIAQSQTDRADALDRAASLLVTQPLGGTRALQLRAESRVETGGQDRAVRDRATGAVLPALSLASDRTLRRETAGLDLRQNGEMLRLNAGLSVQRTRLTGSVDGASAAGLADEIGFRNVRLLPSATVSYSPAQGRNAEVGYQTSTREPSLRELQPVPDVRDPLSVYVGNPALRPEYVHRLNARYFSFDQFTFTNLFAFAQASFTDDAITTSRTVDARLRQTTTPVNAGRAWTATGSASFGTPVRVLRSTVNLSANLFARRGLDLVNGAENTSTTTRSEVDVSLQNRKTDVVDVRAGGRLALGTAAYSLADRAGRKTLDRTAYTEVGWTPTPAWSFRTTFDYTLYAGGLAGDAAGVPLWGAEATRTLMGGRVRLQLSAADLLDRNLGVRTTETAAYVQEERVASLGRRVLLRATVDLAGGARPPGSVVPLPR